MENNNHSYWHTIYHARIAILGIVPPPFGGVSVHIKRVMDCFSLQNNMLLFWSTEQRVRRFLPWYILRLWGRLVLYRPQYVYYHSTYIVSSVIELVSLVLLQRLMKFQLHIVDHDCRHLYKRREITKRLYGWVIKHTQSVICIGMTTAQSYKDNNLMVPNLHVQDAFIPPIKRNERLILETYPSSLKSFIKEHTPLLLMSVAHLMRTGTQDMYGVDVAIKMLAHILDEYPDAGLIIGLPYVKDEVYFQLLQKSMKQLGVAENIYILHGNKEIWPLFATIDLFIRPTLTDGDSISVREALYFNVPVVASDVCLRPAGVHCFAYGNAEDAARITKRVLKEYVYETYRERHPLYAQSMQ